MKRLFLKVLFLFPLAAYAQQGDTDVDHLSVERTTLVYKIDSLEKRLSEIDKLLAQVNPEDRLKAMVSKYGKNKGKMIASGKVWTSVSFEMARDSWGAPSSIQKSVASKGPTEKWIYPEGKYLFFKNGRLESWRE